MAEIKLTFPESRAVIYPAIQRMAAQFDGFKEGPPVTVTMQSTDLDEKKLTKLLKLWRMAKPLKSAQFTIDGVPVTRLTDGEMPSISRCMTEAKYSEDLDAYCNGNERKSSPFFGCRYLKGVSSYHKIPNGKKWLNERGMVPGDIKNPNHKTWKYYDGGIPFSLWATETDGVWKVDTAAIKAKLRLWSKGRGCHLCPFFSWERVDRAIDVKAITAPSVFSTMSHEEIFGMGVSRDEDY